MSDSPSITQQYSFAVGDDGETDGIEPSEESVETSLETFGADVDHRERDTRIDQPEASSFGVDDRKTVTRNGGGEQHALFADTDDDQQTLTGERAASQCLFESDEQDDDRADTASDEPTEATDESTDTTDEASPRAVATDGGQPVEDDTNDPGFAVGTRVEDRDADDPNPAVVVARPDEPAYAREIDALDGKSVADVNPEYGASGPVATVAYADDLDAALDVWHEANPDALGQICADEGVRTYDFPTARLQEATTSDGGPEHDPDEDDENDTERGSDGDEPDTPDRSERSDDHGHDEDTDRDDEPDESPDEGEDTTFDPDAETVTDAWEGAFLSASWGYDQTNVELAQIVALLIADSVWRFYR